MNHNQQSKQDPLQKAIEAFEQMDVPAPPPDGEVLSRVTTPLTESPRPASLPDSQKRRHPMRLAFPSAAAILLLLGGLGWMLLNSTTSIALADVVKATAKHELLRVTRMQITEDDNGRGETKCTVYWDLKSPRFRTESRVGDQVIVTVSDHVQGRRLMTNSKTKDGTLFIHNAKGFSALDRLKKLQEKEATASAPDTLDGRDVVKYVLKERNDTTTLWVDPKTRLPVRMEQETDSPAPNIMLNKFIWTNFEWDPELEGVMSLDELFSTDPPEGYTITEINKTGEDK